MYFPDVPNNHWAAWAVNNMAANHVLTGYPNGLYYGNRPATRYELAAALNQYTSLASQGKLPIASRSEINALNQRITQLEKQLRQRPYAYLNTMA